MNENEIKKTAYWVVGIVIVLIGVVLGLFIYNFYTYPLAENSEKWGQFGDYIGGTLNPILAFLSFSALLFTIYVQVKQLNFADEQLKRTLDELNLSRTELTLTRGELQRSADAQSGSKAVMEQQLLTQTMQQFDSIFFAMLKDLNSLLAELEIKSVGSESLLDQIYLEVINEQIKSIDEQKEKILLNRKLCRYFILLYQLLKIVDKTVEENTYIKGDKNLIKKTYSNIVRASISEQAMQLLMVNVLNDGFESYKNLVEKFSFFEHTSFYKNDRYNLFLINIGLSLKEEAFGHSQYFEKIKNSTLYGDYVFTTSSLNYVKLYWNIFTRLDCDGKLKKIERSNTPNGYHYFIELKEKANNTNILINLRSNNLLPFEIQKQITNREGESEIVKSQDCGLKIFNDVLIIRENESNKELLKINFEGQGSFNYTISDDVLIN